MQYGQTIEGVFLARPNRFIAHVEVDGETRICHVKNTGRCRELLEDGARVILEKTNNPARKTLYDVIAVYKGDRLINMDSQAPNRVFKEWLEEGHGFPNLTRIQPECRYQNSRFDFYLEADGRPTFVEVKGVTLEENGVVLFPDAPTERGVKHINELIEAVQQGYDAYIFFVVQMEDCDYFTPNRATHPAFADALRRAAQSGVHIRAVNCHVSENTLAIGDYVKVVL